MPRCWQFPTNCSRPHRSTGSAVRPVLQDQAAVDLADHRDHLDPYLRGNFNAFDLIYVSQGAIASPNYSTDILGTFLYRTFFGNQLVLGDPYMGATIAGVMFLIFSPAC